MVLKRGYGCHQNYLINYSPGHLSAHPVCTEHTSHSDTLCAVIHGITFSADNTLGRRSSQPGYTQPLPSQIQKPSKETHTLLSQDTENIKHRLSLAIKLTKLYIT